MIKPPESASRTTSAPARPSVLRFTPYAWAKLHWLCFRGDTEIGGFGVAADPEDLLLVTDFITVAQQTTGVSVRFDDAAVADFFESQVDARCKPHQFARIWLHTHPGDSVTPSSIDEETFQRVFGGCDWAVMFILSRSGKTYARLRFNVGPGGQAVIPVEVDYGAPFQGSNFRGWQEEFDTHIHPELHAGPLSAWEGDDFAAWRRYRAAEWELMDMDGIRRELIDSDEWLPEEIEALDPSLGDGR